MSAQDSLRFDTVYARLRHEAPFVQPALTRVVAHLMASAAASTDARLIVSDGLFEAARELAFEGAEGRPTSDSLRALATALVLSVGADA